MAPCPCDMEETAHLERRTLRVLLVINAAMFAGEALAGWLGQSAGLLADSLDMLADALVYGIALLAVGHALSRQHLASLCSGFLQVALGLGVLVDVVIRFFRGSEPVSVLMMAVGGVALAANVTCLLLLVRHRHGGMHMRASWIFSTNDVIANLGVILSGALVSLLDSRLPDLLVGAAIAVVVTQGGLRILRETRRAGASAGGPARGLG